MGTCVDFLNELSRIANPNISLEVKRNRELLKNSMEKHGFENYEKEWWHYQLKKEPFPPEVLKQPFDFPV